MTDFTIATFNVKNLIGPGKEYYRFEQFTDEEYAWKEAWLAEQLVTLDADIVAFQEIFEEEALRHVVNAADTIGKASNDATLPDRSKSYRKKAIFRKLAYAPYDSAALVFAPNINDAEPGSRRPGLAVLSRFGFSGKPEIIQELDPPLTIPFQELGGGGTAGGVTISRLSRPILKVKVPVKGQVITLFNVHLKSKLGEHITPPGADFAPEADLLAYDPVGRAMGTLRAGLRRMAEAWVLRREVVAELQQGNPVIVLGDLNDGMHAVSSEIISGEAPFRNYAWMRRHDAQNRNDRYKDAEAEAIHANVEAVRLHSAEALFVRKSLRDMVYTSAFGVFESIDQILLSQHFHPDNPDKIAEMLYFSAFNDHITDGSHPEAPYNKLASDHGQIMAHFRLKGHGQNR